MIPISNTIEFSFSPKLSFIRKMMPEVAATYPNLDLPRITASELQDLLTSGKIESSQLVKEYIRQIDQHEPYLNAVIGRPTPSSLLQRAQELDDERSGGYVRSRLHGIPVLVKVSS